MSFSFNVTASSRANALAKVEEEIAKVVAAQPDHETDASAIYDTVDQYLDMLHETEGETVSVSVSGSMSWESPAGDAEKRYTGASVNVSVRTYKES